MEKYIYSFNEGSRKMADLLGSKGANLAEMTGIGLPVPFGFTISTDACKRFFEDNQSLAADIVESVYEKIGELENVTGKVFGSAENPLLVSVRSSSPIPMPGIMGTILNLGLNDETVNGLAALTGSRRFALDSYCRFIQMYGTVVLDIPKAEFDLELDTVEMSEEELEAVIGRYKDTVKRVTGKDLPQEPASQLLEAAKSIFRSWTSESVALYREANHIPDSTGVAVAVQAMVFGNMGAESGTGVAFTRNPYTGEKRLHGKFMACAQGEDVTSGLKTPVTVDQMEEDFPEAYNVLVRISGLLEKHYKDMQDMEFTIENNKLYMLQTRDGLRSSQAAVKIAADLAEEGLIDKETAITRVTPEQIEQLMSGNAGADGAERILAMADEIRELKVRTSADSPEEAALAISKGADGIGLCSSCEDLEPAAVREMFRIMGDRPVSFMLRADNVSAQVETIMKAAAEAKAEDDCEPKPDFVLMQAQGCAIAADTAKRCAEESGVSIDYTVGVMLRTPREALTADKIAVDAEFFLFDTKELTRLTFGFEEESDTEPFRTIDVSGVGSLIKTACSLGRQVRPRLRTGICGQHGGDPASIEFCCGAGMTFVSCAPEAVPAARLAAARAAVHAAEKGE
ncbi:MAG: hypothetical protein II354_02430 [Firmicutes bacterium]|nr:hypothetical protein [Bacillota bacterium]